MVSALPRNAAVTVMEEAWDRDCNQWMQVQWNNQRLWAYGNQVRK